MRCIVTGGLGFIGSNLTDRLVELGCEVCVVDNLSTGKQSRLNPKTKWINADIQDDLSSLFAEDDKYDVIFHLGAQARIQPSFQLPIETSSINVLGTMRALELAKKMGAKLVYAGSSSFYGDPHKNPYALSKWLGEEMCIMYNQVYGVPVAIARFFNVYGPRQPTEGQYATVIGIFERQKTAKESLTVTGTGEQRRDFTHVSDIVTGLIAMSCESWNGEIFNLGSGVNFSIKEVAEMFEPQEIIYLPQRPGEADSTLADIQFTSDKLNWFPTVGLEDYINGFLDEVDLLPEDKSSWSNWLKGLFS